MRTNGSRTEELLALGVFGGKSRLRERIEMLLRQGREFSARASMARVAGSTAVLLALIVAGSLAPRWIAFAQGPAFASASVRPGDSQAKGPLSGRVGTTPGRFTGTRASARLLIRWAYDIKDYQLSGGPAWLDVDRFDVEGKADDAATPPQLKAMLRTLLGERFKLAVHREAKAMAVYNLVVGKGGVKFPEKKPGDTPLVGPLRPGMTGRMYAASIGAFADMLSTFPDVGKPVLEKTGLTANYLIDIQTSPDDDDNSFALVQDQGLRLEPANASIEMVVIDHIEKPDAN